MQIHCQVSERSIQPLEIININERQSHRIATHAAHLAKVDEVRQHKARRLEQRKLLIELSLRQSHIAHLHCPLHFFQRQILCQTRHSKWRRPLIPRLCGEFIKCRHLSSKRSKCLGVQRLCATAINICCYATHTRDQYPLQQSCEY